MPRSSDDLWVSRPMRFGTGHGLFLEVLESEKRRANGVQMNRTVVWSVNGVVCPETVHVVTTGRGHPLLK